jgi:hypothetical protein
MSKNNQSNDNDNEMTDEQKRARLEEIGKCVTDFVNDDRSPAILKWGLQILFIASTEEDTKSGAVGGLLSCGQRAFNTAIAKAKADGHEALAKKLDTDKNDMIKMALQLDFRGAMTSVLNTKLKEIAGEEGEEPEEAPAPKVIVVEQPKPSKESSPFAGRN